MCGSCGTNFPHLNEEISSLIWIQVCFLSVPTNTPQRQGAFWTCGSTSCPQPQKRRNVERGWVSPSPAAAEHSIGNILLSQGFNSAKSGSIPSPGLYLRLVGITSLQTSRDFSRVCWTDLDKTYLCQGILSSTCPQHSAPPEQTCELRQLRQGKLLPQSGGPMFQPLGSYRKHAKGTDSEHRNVCSFPCCLLWRKILAAEPGDGKEAGKDGHGWK